MIIIYIVIRENENQSTEYICADRRSKYRRFFLKKIYYFIVQYYYDYTQFFEISPKKMNDSMIFY